jgi:hypothetical protein
LAADRGQTGCHWNAKAVNVLKTKDAKAQFPLAKAVNILKIKVVSVKAKI